MGEQRQGQPDTPNKGKDDRNQAERQRQQDDQATRQAQPRRDDQTNSDENTQTGNTQESNS